MTIFLTGTRLLSYKFPFICNCSCWCNCMDRAKAVILPAPKPLAPFLSKTSKKNVSFLNRGLVKICTRILSSSLTDWSALSRSGSASESKSSPNLENFSISKPPLNISALLLSYLMNSLLTSWDDSVPFTIDKIKGIECETGKVIPIPS